MAFEGNKKEKLTILEDIYHEDIAAKPAKIQIKEYFSDSKRIEKLLSASILSVGLVALLLGLFQIKNNIDHKDKIAQKSTVNQVDTEDLLGLKQKDTDEDGLSDYDELKVYKTSPYLIDTDSDGFDDKTEIVQGTDPVCPEGQNCFAVWSENPLTNPNDKSASAEVQTLDPVELRLMLKQAGMSDEQLDSLSDEEIINAYQQILGQQDSQVAAAPAEQNVSLTLPLEQLKNLTPAEIRELLQTNANIPKETLDNISDDELMNLVNETLANYNANGN